MSNSVAAVVEQNSMNAEATPFNFIEYANEVVMMAVHDYYRFNVSLDDVVELMAMRVFNLSHQTVHNWTQAEVFFNQCQNTTGVVPTQLTTDKEPALYPAIKNAFADDTKHRDSKYMNNRVEQNHRGIKSRFQPMKGFKDFLCARIFCTVFEEIRQLFRAQNKTRAENRGTILSRIQDFNKLLMGIV